ncbi:MAG: fibronectin type III domain-containing protein [Anaerolineae bacterium]|nr:fibronectin type III domain-containing protein [Anaerolineae bacterium]
MGFYPVSVPAEVDAAQVGAEVFSAPRGAEVDAPQVGAEVFSTARGAEVDAPQAVVEVWWVASDGTAIVSAEQIGAEVWFIYQPDPPIDLEAKARSYRRIRLTWTNPDDVRMGWRIERSSDGINFSTLAEIGPSLTLYDDAGLDPNTRYYYRVVALVDLGDSVGVGEYSEIVSAITYSLSQFAPVTSVSFGTTLITTDHLGIEHRISDARSKQWFLSYDGNGSGFGYLSFKLNRKTGVNYPDIGYAFPVVLKKGPFRVLFDGQITKISESTGKEDSIEVWCLGWAHVATGTPYNKVFSDVRTEKWFTSDVAQGSFRPDKYRVSMGREGVVVGPENTDFSAGDYCSVWYVFSDGSPFVRLTGDYELTVPSGYPCKVEILDGAANSLWSVTASGSGSIDVTSSAEMPIVEIRFSITAGGTSTADIAQIVFSGLRVASVADDAITANMIAEDIAATLMANGLSGSTAKIDDIGLSLAHAAFEDDASCAEVLSWCCKFGDSLGRRVAWGVSMDDRRDLFLLPVNDNEIKYVIAGRSRGSEFQKGADWSDSAQRVYATYTDANGQKVQTGTAVSPAVIQALGGYYRTEVVSLNVSSNEEAEALLGVWLNDNSRPVADGSYQIVGFVNTPQGAMVPFDEIVPGGLVQVSDWRAVEVTIGQNDFTRNSTVFPLQGVRVDEDSLTAELIPVRTSDAFSRYMAIIEELRG